MGVEGGVYKGAQGAQDSGFSQLTLVLLTLSVSQHRA